MYLLDRSKDKISRVEDDSFSNPIKQTVIANTLRKSGKRLSKRRRVWK